MKVRACKDCEPGVKRPAPHPGPRCSTHHRLMRRKRKEAVHANTIEKKYGLSADAYDALYQAQGGRCAICQVSTGKTKRLAVDHDHACCPGGTSCGKCVRGLLCGRCNYHLLGWYSVEALVRAAEYLRSPPAQRLHEAVPIALSTVGTPDAARAPAATSREADE